MPNNLLSNAVLNNALWCDAVCAAQQKPGEFRERIWLQRNGAPRYYPDAITLAADGRRAQEKSVLDIGRLRPEGLSVKDSFCELKLDRHGFEVLFEADWIAMHAPHTSRMEAGTTWKMVSDPSELLRWEIAWSGTDAISETSPIFRPELLNNPDICFLMAHEKGVAIGGGILNRATGVVGLSNLFSLGVPTSVICNGLIDQAARRFPQLPLIGYERGEDLEVFRRLGFETIGRLRVWLRR